ncbi:MAG: tetratricopeptide repeat protein [Thermoplasmata archaeon]
MARTILCPKCNTKNDEKAIKCRKCGEEFIPKTLEFLLNVPGVSTFVVQNLLTAGFKTVSDLKNASARELTKVSGISKLTAQKIKEQILKMELSEKERKEEEPKVSLYICSNCGALLSSNARTCPQCGALVEQNEASEVPVERKPAPEEEKIIQEMEKPKVELYLCSNCGAFVSSDAARCPTCGAIMDVGEQEHTMETPGKPEKSVEIVAHPIEDGAIIGICSACGAFLSKNAQVCPVCGAETKEKIEVAITSTAEPQSSQKIETPINVDFAISTLETETKIFLCEVCGAFVSEGAEVCPICNSPTTQMKKEIIKVGGEEKNASEEVISLLEKEIMSAAMEGGEGEPKPREAVMEVREGKVEDTPSPQEILDFSFVEDELSRELPLLAEHIEEDKKTGNEEPCIDDVVKMEHLSDVQLAVSAELGDILVEDVVKKEFTDEEEDVEKERVEHHSDPIGEVESELWEYMFAVDEEDVEEQAHVEEEKGILICPICGYKNSSNAKTCEICGSLILPDEMESEGAPKKVKKILVVEPSTQESGGKFTEVKFKNAKEPKTAAKPQTASGTAVATLTRIKPEVPKPEEKTILEKYTYFILVLTLVTTGIVVELLFGFTMLAVGILALAFLCTGAIFTLIIKWQHKQKVLQTRIHVSPKQGSSKPTEIAMFNMGSTYLATGRYEDAVRAFESVVAMNPGNEIAWNNLGSALSKLERHEEALKCYEKALGINPKFEIAWNNKGNALARLGRFEEAIQSYDRAIEIKRDYHDAWVNKGYVLVKIGKYNEAIECANTANKLLGGNYA